MLSLALMTWKVRPPAFAGASSGVRCCHCWGQAGGSGRLQVDGLAGPGPGLPFRIRISFKLGDIFTALCVWCLMVDQALLVLPSCPADGQDDS